MRRLVTAFAALLGLLALVAGTPLLLLRVGSLPDRVPSWSQLSDALTAPDDGTLVPRILTVVGWLAWASFAAGVLLEIPGRLRGRAIRVRGLRMQQRVAAALVGAILAVFAGSALASAAPVARPAVVLTLPQAPAPPIAVTPVVRQTQPAVLQRPVYIVKRGDYLGKIAERFTGDFDRYHQIAALNPKLVRNPNLIRPGWRLTLPIDAQDRGASRHATGRVLLPAPPKPPAATPPSTAVSPAESPAVSPSSTGTPKARAEDTKDGGVSPLLVMLAGLAAAGVLTGHAVLWRRRIVRIHRHQVSRHRVRTRVEPVGVKWPVEGTATATIPVQSPPPVAQTSPVEIYEPKVRQPAAASDRLDASLRRLALGLRSRPAWAMPDIFAAWHYAGELGVVLAAPCADPPEPYAARSADTWALPSGAEVEFTDDAPAPLPGLLTLGTWPEGGELLVDSERTGLLTIVGDPENSDDLLRHLAAEAATAAWADTAAVLVTGFNSTDTRALGALNEARVRSVPSVEDALSRVARRAVVNRSVLRESGIADTMSARINSASGSLWTTHILFVADPWGQHTGAIEELDAQLAEFGRVGVSVVATHPTTTRWSVTVDAGGALDMPWLAFSDTTACRLSGTQLGALASATGNPEYAGMPIAGARHRSRT
ncbi:MAG: LysM peptidoglycan-binding domain-containing protein [Hamadaea sp.]|uniref:LysM peptidoglycan-binding domain-containing protein n=1 Tax=Hamadaea sp. TaxID=2024425 RepID=UPI00182AC8A7|nr:LysM peptidoglycan-binding domain-containing protein [Hamadaea sp.]NUR72212.1 LysM peptidoglycan-binding domain-containing protein [Hamadaea sp.]NUT22105.1 LysM peptidoglycan-binding domain-containing protein [Hamadaea sp.]